MSIFSKGSFQSSLKPPEDHSKLPSESATENPESALSIFLQNVDETVNKAI